MALGRWGRLLVGSALAAIALLALLAVTNPGLTLVGLVSVAGVAMALLAASRRAQFVTGGALVNLGYRMQDHLEDFDLDGSGAGAHTPTEVFEHVLQQNQLAATVRDYFPRTPRRPVVALVLCMDGRLDSAELVGDTRKYYYVIRTAGSVLSNKEQEMLELAVVNGVRVVLHTTHTACAAEKVAADPEQRTRFPNLAKAVDSRADSLAQFRERPEIARRLGAGELAIRQVQIDTETARMTFTPGSE